MEQILPVIDNAVLQEKANEYAMKGALKVLEDFYTGYNSPYKKAIEKELEGKTVDSYGIKLPNVLAMINDSLTAEIDAIANTAIAKTFVPMVSKMLTGHEKNIHFSSILKEFIKTAGYEPDYEEFRCSVEKDQRYEWLNVSISDADREYSFTLHENYETKKLPSSDKTYSIMQLPNNYGRKSVQTMKISLDGGATLEMPFTKDVLKDEFVAHLAGVIIVDSAITMDTDYFNEELFPENDCHCH